MARATLQRRLAAPLRWQVARLVNTRPETATARTLRLQVPAWPGHLPGQHVDVRLTAEDGYSAQRSYSLAAPADADTIELTVQLVADGEVSPFLVHDYALGDPIEVRGPVGGWFVWQPADPDPLLLLGGGSGIVPLMAMLRAHQAAASTAPLRLIYSVRSPAEVYYADELRRYTHHSDTVDASIIYTRTAPDGAQRPPQRLTPTDLAGAGWPAHRRPRCYLCGPTGFVETAANMLVALGHDQQRIRTERFGPSGG